jgi:signal transduction histidine kinase
LTIHTRWPAGGTGVEVWVDDSGHGVDPAEVEALFEPFQGHRKGGVGIGLAISRQIAREHGGDLALLPLPRGTRAILHLPSSECAPAAVTSPPSGFR